MSEHRAGLAARCGIIPHYHDIWGRLHTVSEATVDALLRAMDVAPDEGCAPPPRLLAPATVRRADERPLRIPLAPPPGCPPRLDWRLVLEDGGTHSGSIAPHDTGELVLDLALPCGYHHLAFHDGDTELACGCLIVAPRRCYRPPALEGEGRIWGTAVQLYGLRSERNWGMGDFSDLKALVEAWGEAGGSLVGVNPLHALFPHNPAHISPYSPSSRLFRNILYLDVEAVTDFHECEEARARVFAPEFQDRLEALRATELVDYPGVAAAKLEILALLYAAFREHHLAVSSARGTAFRRFQAEQGRALRRHALFEALQARFHAEDASVWGWPVWPEAYRDPDGEAVAGFEAEEIERVEFYEYLQWQADVQLAAVAARATQAGSAVGLYQDLAVSIDRGGAEAWAGQRRYAFRASVGAPPDELNLKGQDWGLPPINPVALEAAGFTPFIATVRANMRHAGALRIDHVMGLMRLFWVPAGIPATEGAYVRYPVDALLGILALESVRNQCLVIGEDLGTVPDEMRHALADAGVLSYRLLYFERGHDGSFKPPRDFIRDATVTPTTHDLPTLTGWWQGRDLTLRTELDLYPSEEMRERDLVGRVQDRARLLIALDHAGLLPHGLTTDPACAPSMTPALVRAIVAYLAATPSCVLVVPMEDVSLELEQANLPGTVDQHPNWRRKLALALEDLRDDEHFTALAADLVRARGRSQPPARRAAAVTRIPRATYRLQLYRDFGFDAAAALVPYLDALGVSHVYCSPLLRARPGSRHGYDIVDHDRLNPEIGSDAAFERFHARLQAHGMGLVMDVVPNHMAALGADNAWWMDVLENGEASAYADFFDIDWQPPDVSLAGKVLVPVLGDHYGRILESGELRVVFDADSAAFALRYYGHRFPINPRAYPLLLAPAAARLPAGTVAAEVADEFASLVDAFGRLPPREEAAPQERAVRRRDAAVLRGRLGELAAREPALVEAIAAAVEAINGRPGEPASFDALDALLDAQAYRLANWRTASDEINYRRFFDVNDLAALRMERREVFDATHRYVLALAAEGKIDALRIDHPDGLYDPAAYFARLQAEYAALAAARGVALGDDPRPLYIVIEKIDAAHESLPERWAVHGTTGYRFANLANGLFIDGEAKRRLDRCWRAFVDDEAESFEDAAYHGKRATMAGALAAELTAQASALLRLARSDRRTRDFTLNTLRQALAQVVACLPVYRTYIDRRPSAQDRRFIDWAVAQARRRAHAADPSIFDFVRDALLLQPPEGAPRELALAYRHFVHRFQQFTGAVTAKGIEDTAFYTFNRLVSANEVGSQPEQLGTTVAAFHHANAERATRWPHTMLATSTHDTKRSEDVRCRIDVLSEMPAVWRLAVRRWSLLNRSRRLEVDGLVAPSPNDEYLYYQTLLGTFPLDVADAEALADYRARIAAYMLKAAREAKRHTSWINMNAEYENGLTSFVDSTLAQLDGNLFLDSLRPLAAQLAWFGALNSLSLALLKLAAPGVPDIYQGNEVLDFSLVDPDNRRPVDYARRIAMLGTLRALAEAGPPAADAGLAALGHDIHDGRLKLWVIWRGLQARRRRPEVFRDGDYLPLAASGAEAEHVVAFARRGGRSEAAGVIAVAGRLYVSLGVEAGTLPSGAAAWGDTRIDLSWLPAGTRLTDAISGLTVVTADDGIALAELLAVLPVALLEYDLTAPDQTRRP